MNFYILSLFEKIQPFITIFLLLSSLLLIFLEIQKLLRKKKFNLIRENKVLILIFVFGLFLRLFFVKHSFLNFDLRGYQYLNNAENILTFKLGVWQPNKGYAVYFLWNLVLRLFDKDEVYVFYFNSIVGSLLIITFYIFVKLLIRSKIIGLYSSFLFSIYPLYIKLSATEEFTVFYLFFLLASLSFFIVYLRNNSFLYIYNSVIFFSLAFQTRAEGLTLIFSLFLLCFLFGKFEKISFKNVVISLLIFLIFNLGYINILSQLFINRGPTESTSWINTQLSVFFDLVFNKNYNILINNEMSPLIYIIFFIGGLLFLVSNKKKRTMFFLGFLFVFNMWFYLNGMTYNVIEAVRWQGNFLYLYLIFCGVGLYWFDALLKKRLKCLEILIITIIIFITLFNSYKFLNASYSHNKEHDFFKKNVKNIPANCKIVKFSEFNNRHIFYNFPYYLFDKNKVVEMKDFMTNSNLYANEILKEGKCYIFYKGLICNRAFFTELIYENKDDFYKNKEARLAYKFVEKAEQNFMHISKNYERSECKIINEKYLLKPLIEKRFNNTTPSYDLIPENFKLGFYKLYPIEK